MVPRGAAPATFAMLLAVTVPLAGCLGGPSPTGPGETVDPDQEPHRHDLWHGRTQVTILDDLVPVDWEQQLRDDPAVAVRPAVTLDLGLRRVDGEPQPNLVYPGTARMEVTLAWEGGLGETMRVCATHEGVAGDMCAQGFGATVEDGETWTITTNSSGGDVLSEDTWDDPHARWSRWRFQVWLCVEPTRSVQCTADVTVSTFRLNVTIHRTEGELPLGPPHPPALDRWDGRDRLALLNETLLSSGTLQANWFGQAYQQATGDSRPYWYVSGFQLTTPPMESSSEVPVVPLGTERLEAVLDVRAANSEQAPLQLMYQTAADGWYAPWRPLGDPCSDRCTSSVAVNASETDAPYARQTMWAFAIFPADVPATPLVDYEVRLGIEVARSP